MFPRGCVLLLASLTVFGQARRTPDGQPDLQGVYQYSTITPLERPAEFAGKPSFATKKEADDWGLRQFAQITGDRRDGGPEADVGRSYNEFWRDRGSQVVPTLRTSLVIDPPDGKVPALTAAALKRQADVRDRTRGHAFDGPEDRNLWERCLSRSGAPMVPGPYNNNIQIVQSAGSVVILEEMIHEVRTIPLDGRPHVPSNIRSILGDSRGHWEGDTLVIDTTNFSERSNFRGASENLHLTERIRRSDANTILYEFTVDDPTTFARKWTVEVPMTAIPNTIVEYACQEGNYGLAGMLEGARADEKKATQKK